MSYFITGLLTTLLLLVGCKTEIAAWLSERPANASPPFFRVESGKGAELDLLGTIHVGPEEGWTYPEPVASAIRDADALVLEIDLRALTEELTSDAILRHGILPPETPLSTIISAETASALASHEDALAESGATPFVREAMQPWFIMMTLVESVITQSNYTPDRAVEQDLLAAIGDGELLGLETIDDQLGMMARLPLETQELILVDMLARLEDADRQLNEFVEAWRRNDPAALIGYAYQGIDETPGMEDFYDVIVDERNRSWLNPLVEILEDPDRAGTRVLVGVGALHLVGETGLPNLLREAGYRVEERRAPPTRGSAKESHE